MPEDVKIVDLYFHNQRLYINHADIDAVTMEYGPCAEPLVNPIMSIPCILLTQFLLIDILGFLPSVFLVQQTVTSDGFCEMLWSDPRCLSASVAQSFDVFILGALPVLDILF